MEQARGFVHDMLDVKVLVLYGLSLFDGPVAFATLLEVCMQDSGAGYFDLQEAVTQLERTGHLTGTDRDAIALTDQGRAHGQLTQDSLAAPLRQRVLDAARAWKADQKRQRQVQAQVLEDEDGGYLVRLWLNSPAGRLMELTLPASDLKQARQLRERMDARAEGLYAALLDMLLRGEEPGDAG